MYSIAIAIYDVAIVTYHYYWNTFLGKIFFVTSWCFWLYFALCIFVVYYLFLIALIGYERKCYVDKKINNDITHKMKGKFSINAK